jgi:Lhr-like helicase
MDLKELEKAQRLYARIKELDAEIISIERLALLASTKKTSIKLSLTIEDLEKSQRFREDNNRLRRVIVSWT